MTKYSTNHKKKVREETNYIVYTKKKKNSIILREGVARKLYFDYTNLGLIALWGPNNNFLKNSDIL